MAHYSNPNHQSFLLTFFPKESNYEVREVNGFVLVKYFSNNTHEWEVGIYTPESFAERQKYLDSVNARKVSNSEQTTMV